MPNDLNGEFPVDPHLTAIAVAYRNPDKVLIANSVLPRDNSLTETMFKYSRATNIHQAFSLPNTSVGQKGTVNRLELQMDDVYASTEDEAIDVPLGAYDLKRKGAREFAVQLATSVVQLRHEKKVADLVFNNASYPTGQKVALAGTSRLDDPGYTGNPLGLIDDALNAMLLRGNVITFGLRSWSVFRKLPAVLKAINGNDGGSGLATKEAVASLFGVQEVLVGEGWLNTAKIGAAPNMAQVWGPHIAILHRDRTASTQGGVTFGLTAQYGDIIAGSIPEPTKMGMRGGELVRAGESVKPVIVAPYGGYFIENAVS